MGLSSSKASSGQLSSARVPALALPRPPPPEKRINLKVRCPDNKKGWDKIAIMTPNGIRQTITIPAHVKPGETFDYKTEGGWRHVTATTLHAVPGTTIVEIKPVIWTSASHAFYKCHFNDQKEQISMAKKVSGLLETANKELLEKAVEEECNAVLGMNINITTDSSGERGNSKFVAVSIWGTPCVIVSDAALASTGTSTTAATTPATAPSASVMY